MQTRSKLIGPWKARMLVVVLVAAAGSALGQGGPRSLLLPFSRTGDLLVLDTGSGSVLRITPEGAVSVEIDAAEIKAVTGKSTVSFADQEGLAFDGRVDGAMYFNEKRSASLLVFEQGELSILTSEADLTALSGELSARPLAVTFDSEGSLFITENIGKLLLKVDQETGIPSVQATRDAFEDIQGIVAIDMDGGLVAGEGGLLYMPSDEAPKAFFEITSEGAVTLLATNQLLSDPDLTSTRAPNGDVIVADDRANAIIRITPQGVMSEFISEADLESVVGPGNADLGGGIAFDSQGNFYVANSGRDFGTQDILKFDSMLNGSIFVSSDDITAVTGATPALDGSIAFVPLPEPRRVIHGVVSLCVLGFLVRTRRRSTPAG